MKFKPIGTSRVAIPNIFGESAQFRDTYSKLSDITITFQIIGRSIRIIAKDLEHSAFEERYYCFGKISENIVTVRFTYRNNKIRILEAGYWRKGKQIYEKENKV